MYTAEMMVQICEANNKSIQFFFSLLLSSFSSNASRSISISFWIDSQAYASRLSLLLKGPFWNKCLIIFFSFLRKLSCIAMRTSRKEKVMILIILTSVAKNVIPGTGDKLMQFKLISRDIIPESKINVEKPITYIRMILLYFSFFRRKLSPPGICLLKQ